MATWDGSDALPPNDSDSNDQDVTEIGGQDDCPEYSDVAEIEWEDSRPPRNSQDITVTEFLHSIGLPCCIDRFSERSCEELIRMSRDEIRLIMTGRPRIELGRIIEGIRDFGEILYPNALQNFPVRLPNLEKFLRSGLPSKSPVWRQSVRLNMREFFEWPESCWHDVNWPYVSEMSDCRHALFNIVLELKEDEKQMQEYLASIFQERHQCLFLARDQSLDSVRRISTRSVLEHSIGMDPLDAALFIFRKNYVSKYNPTSSTANPEMEQQNRTDIHSPSYYADIVRRSTYPDGSVSQRPYPFSRPSTYAQSTGTGWPTAQTSLNPSELQNLYSQHWMPKRSRLDGDVACVSQDIFSDDVKKESQQKRWPQPSPEESLSRLGYPPSLWQQKGDSEVKDISGTTAPPKSASNYVSKILCPDPLLSLFPLFDPPTALNILLLGESDSPKPIFINAFLNYVHHGTPRKTRDNKMVGLIPTDFTVLNGNNDLRTVYIGSKETIERYSESTSKSCKSYVFPSEKGLIRIIDTPTANFGTTGLDQDLFNFHDIVNYVPQYGKLHAICILHKINDEKYLEGFRLGMKQLFSYLGKSASRNIIFLSTKPSSTIYQPGDIKPALKEVLNEIENNPPNIKIQFDHSTSYCVSTESFKFLAAIKSGFDFRGQDFRSYAVSYLKSVAECKRLIQYIQTLRPNDLDDTISINEARRIVEDFGNRIADIMFETAINLVRFRQRLQFLKANRDTKDFKNFQKELLKPMVAQVYWYPLECHRTVCASELCVGYNHLNGDVEFQETCHAKCYLPRPTSECIGDPNLESCDKFFVLEGHCYECPSLCSWKEHKCVSHLKFMEEVKEEAIGLEALIEEAKTISDMIKDLEYNIQLYKKEGKILLDAMAFFYVYQSVKSISEPSDPFLSYLQDHLKMEKYKSRRLLPEPEKNEKIIKYLELFINNYNATKSKLISGHENNESMEMILDNWYKYEKQLYDLKIHGFIFHDLGRAIQKRRMKNLPESFDFKTYDGYPPKTTAEVVKWFFEVVFVRYYK